MNLKNSSKIGKDVYDAIDIEKSIRSKKATGSTSPSNVKKQAKKILTSMKLYGYA